MEMMPLVREDPTTLLEAALEGRVDTLNSLIQRDPLILHKASLTSMSETPLHVSSLMGHLDFTCAVLNRHPKMASELDTSKRSPLHLASAEGHAEIVEALLRAEDGICLGRDKDGRIPLHLAAMRGRIEVIRKLISARPDSIYLLLDGDTSLHLCVRYNHLEALKIFVEMIDDDDLVNNQDKDGNTVLHLATLLQHVEILKYLISVPKVRASAVITVNKLGFTAFEVLEHGPRDLKTMEIRRILMEASPVTKTRSDNDELGQQQTPTISRERTMKRWFKNLMQWLDYQGNWMEEMRGALMIVATVIATISFQVSTNPPGGVLQANWTDDKNLDYLSIFLECINKNKQKYNAVECQLPGKAVLGYVYQDGYNQLAIYNTVAFMASVSIILLITTGFPLQNKFFMWFLTLAMGVAVTSLAVTYLLSLLMISPFYGYFNLYYHDASVLMVGANLFWLGLLSLVGAINIIRFLYWVGKKLKGLLHKMLSKFQTKRERKAISSRREHRLSPGVQL